ncbi:MAG: 2-C-methyl-D-erythritol 2,4-cyclodiphosphate synthase [Acidobacteriota bacterium]
MRVGIGFDIHPLVGGRELILGGKKIDFEKGLLGHSDGDVLIHSVIDSILGAVGEKNIGEFFPDSDPKYRGISSLKLLQKIAKLLKRKNSSVMNIDSVIIAQKPEITPHVKDMKKNISKVLGISEQFIGIKAKSHEGIGEIGRGEAISCYSVVLVKEKKK